jgi:CRISPR system Cascade subunit CasA
MTKGFNLVDAGWIPCVPKRGPVESHGVCHTLQFAHTFKEIRDGSPLVTIALHRLLLAVLHRVFGPTTPDAWETLWGRKQFDSESVP